ncbi:MAG TPA: hypothetical protein VKN35_11875 [Xanthomonadales bacterium]|nr:hypothetical protein [Xanthomonadales bacterium]
MPGPLLHIGATVLCTHGGQAQATAPNPRVLVSGQPTVQVTAPYAIGGCPFTTGSNPLPCLTGQWTVAALRVTSSGQPLVLMDSQSLCTPNGTPMLPVAAQTRAVAS